MGLRQRMRARPVTLEVINRHNQHEKLTWADWPIKKLRLEARQAREKRDAEWMMKNQWRWHLMDKEEDQ